MGSWSVSTHRGLFRWQGLLLVASLLNFWSQLTTAQVTVESVDALEGNYVTLSISHNAQDVEYIVWYRGRTFDNHYSIAYLSVSSVISLTGPSDERAIVQKDGSLLLKNVTMKDSDFYTVLVQLEGCQKMIACGRLDVYPHVSVPTLLASSTTVRENKDAVVFTCNTNANTIQWLFNFKYVRYTRRMKLSHDRRNLTIDPVQREDAGNYQCKASNPRSSRRSAVVRLSVEFE
ncbi:cell adhesion molecule CEACAM21-like [Glossophaga mutica]